MVVVSRGVYLVVVTLRTAPEALLGNLEPLAGQVAGVVIVDNSDQVDVERWSCIERIGPLRPIVNGGNAGVARAINQGVGAALQDAAEFVLILDDDSEPDPRMLPALLEAWDRLQRDGRRVAAVGPDFRDRVSGRRALFVRSEGAWLRREPCAPGAGTVMPSDYLMSSGSLIHRGTFDAVGTMEEGLFIDYVDTEWCLRARSLGYRCYGACGAHMEHCLGEESHGWMLPYRPPVRTYFISRNLLLLLRRGYLPAAWKLVELRRLLVMWLLRLLAGPARVQHLRMVIAGIGDGLLGRTGPGPLSAP